MTMSENCVLMSEPLTSSGTENGCPGPGESDSAIAGLKERNRRVAVHANARGREVAGRRLVHVGGTIVRLLGLLSVVTKGLSRVASQVNRPVKIDPLQG